MKTPVICESCGGIAVYSLIGAKADDIVKAKDFVHLDGSEVSTDERPLCDSCGVKLQMFVVKGDGTLMAKSKK